jgi:hypothetical protein
MTQHNDHSEDTEDVSVGIAVRYVDSVQVLPFGGDDHAGINIDFVDHRETPAVDDEWGLDNDTDFGMKLSISNLDPEMAAQLLLAAAQFLQDTEWEEVESTS